MQNPILTGLSAVADRYTQTLMLGSFPGAASLAAQQYYGHPRNQFWSLLATLLDEPLATLPYGERLERLLVHRIGVWDVIASCERSGSLDSAIRNPVHNDFAVLRQRCPGLFRVCFNGKTAAKFEPHFTEIGLQTLVLPSSSPANAQLSFAEKLQAWRGIIDGL